MEIFSDHKIYQHIKIRTDRCTIKNHQRLQELSKEYKIEPNVRPVITQKGCYMEIDIKGFFDSIPQFIEFTERLKFLQTLYNPTKNPSNSGFFHEHTFLQKYFKNAI